MPSQSWHKSWQAFTHPCHHLPRQHVANLMTRWRQQPHIDKSHTSRTSRTSQKTCWVQSYSEFTCLGTFGAHRGQRKPEFPRLSCYTLLYQTHHLPNMWIYGPTNVWYMWFVFVLSCIWNTSGRAETSDVADHCIGGSRGWPLSWRLWGGTSHANVRAKSSVRFKSMGPLSANTKNLCEHE